MRHARRCSHRARRSVGALALALGLLISCGGSDPATVASDEPIEIASFAATPAPDADGLGATFVWTLRGPTARDAACLLDADGDGNPDVEVTCAAGRATYTYARAGTYRAELRPAAGEGSANATVVVPGDDPSRTPELPDPEASSDAPAVLGEFPPSLPYLYDRVVADEHHVAVGVPSDPADEADPGRVIIHARGDDGAWDRTVVVRPPSDAVDAFGEHLALDGTTLGITGNRRDPETGAREAVVYLFERSADDEWVSAAVLLGGEGVAPGSLTLALRGSLLAVAHRPSFAEAGAGGAGFDIGPAVRLFERDAGGPAAWEEIEPILAPDRDDGRAGFFGADVAIAPGGDLLAVADTAQESDSGFGTYVFLFERSAPGEAWTAIRTFRDDELPSPYSAMLELDDDALVVTPMASRETTRAELTIFGRGAGGPDAWGPLTTVTVEVATPPDAALPRDVLLATSLAGESLAVGIGPSACMDLRAEPGPGPAPCAGGRVYLLAPAGAGGTWDVRRVIDDPSGALRSSYGEYVALGPHGRTLAAGGVVLPEDGPAHTRIDVYENVP